MAVGIMSFALVGLIGLLPVGLSQFRQAIDLTVSSQITQELAAMVQRAGTQGLDDLGTASDPDVTYYDSEGARLTGDTNAYAYKAQAYVAGDADMTHMLSPTWTPTIGPKPLPSINAVHIQVTSRTAPDRPYTSVLYVPSDS